jgi:hypothetical protein
MKLCPQCGRSEKEISMTTDAENVADNKANCPCGWNGTYGALKDDGKKPAKVEAPTVEPETPIETSAEAPDAENIPEEAAEPKKTKAAKKAAK